MKFKTIIPLALVCFFAASLGTGCLGPEEGITSEESQVVGTASIKADGSSAGEASAFRADEPSSSWTCNLAQFTQAALDMVANHPGSTMTSCTYDSATGSITYGYRGAQAVP